MYEAIGLAYFVLIAVFLQVLVDKACANTSQLRCWSSVLSMAALVWSAMGVIRPFFLDALIPPVDGIYHQQMGQEIADQLACGFYDVVSSKVRVGNAGYQLLLGCLYWAFCMPPQVMYAVNGAFAFWGLLTLVEVICRLTACHRASFWLIAIPFFSFSPMWWTTTNLKEGPVLWGICMSLRLVLYYAEDAPRPGVGLTLAGILLGGLLRPHIMAAWLLAIGMGIAISKRRFSLAALSVVASAGAILLLQMTNPQVIESMIADGAADTFEEGYHSRCDIGGSAIHYAAGKPIPFLSGLLLLLARPLPHEISPLAAIVPGIEAWTISFLMIFYWSRSNRRAFCITNPIVATAASALCIFSVHFTYMYNMGLMVRQRVQVFPALLVLALAPALLATRVVRTKVDMRKSGGPRLTMKAA